MSYILNKDLNPLVFDKSLNSRISLHKTDVLELEDFYLKKTLRVF